MRNLPELPRLWVPETADRKNRGQSQGSRYGKYPANIEQCGRCEYSSEAIRAAMLSLNSRQNVRPRFAVERPCLPAHHSELVQQARARSR